MADTFNMSDVFLSYSRKDTDFCHKLFDAFKAQKLEVWADFEDIPLTADWWKEIQAGINAADAFIFIISPDSVRSDICRQEIDHAVQMNKRILPVLYREVTEDADKELMHQAISSHNWIFFRDEEEFDKDFATLLQSVQTDLEHNRIHTRLLVRANEWRENGHGGSYLLQGEDLTEAESWLTQSMGKSPSATPLHAEYISASRNAQNARQRRFLTLVVGALVVSLLLTLFAIFQWRDAQDARERAEAAKLVADQNALEARSLALAANAGDALSSDNPDLGLALAMQSISVNVPIIESSRALADAAYSPGTRTVIDGHEGLVWQVTYSPDGSTLLSGSSDHRACIWDSETGALVMCLGGDEDTHQDDITAIAYGQDGKHVFTASLDGTAIIWDIDPESSDYGKKLQTVDYGDKIASMAIAPHEDFALLGMDNGLMYRWNFEDNELIRFQRGHVSSVNVIAFDRNGRFAISGGSDKHLVIWDVEKRHWVDILDGHDDSILSIAYDSPNNRLLSGSADNMIILWDLLTGRPLRTYIGHDSGVTDLVFGPSSNSFISASWDNSIRVWNMDTAQVIRRFSGHTGGINTVSLRPDNQQIASGSYDQDIRLWDVAGFLEDFRLSGDNTIVNKVTYSHDGSMIASAHYSGAVYLWDARTGEKLRALRGHTSQVTDVAFSRDDSRLASITSSRHVRVWDIETRTQVAHIRSLEARPVVVVFTSDPDIMMLAMSDRLRWYNLQSGEIEKEILHDGRSIAAADLSPDDKLVIIGTSGASNNLMLIDVDSGEVLHNYEGHRDGILAVAFNSDGSKFVSGSWDNSVRVWESDSEQPLHVFIGHIDRVTSVAFAADNSHVVSGSNDRSVRLWNLELGTEEFHYEGHTSRVTTVSFSPDDKYILSGSRDEDIVQWRMPHTLNGLLEWTELNRYVRDLTCIERERYLREEIDCFVEDAN